ncbi:MAG: hypothetical protein ACTSU5_20075 [Promethearchaeota archaeon]
MFFEYSAPFVVDPEAFGGNDQRSASVPGGFFGEVGAAFCLLENETRGKVRKIGEFKFLSLAYWPFWLVPVNGKSSLILDGLGLSEFKVPAHPKQKARDVERVLKSKNVGQFAIKLRKLNFDVQREARGGNWHEEAILGLFHPEILAYLSHFFLRVARIPSDSFFLYEPVVREAEVLKQRAKLNYLVHGEGTGGILGERDRVLSIVDGHLEHFSQEVASLDSPADEIDELESEIEELRDQLAGLRGNPPRSSDADLLRSGKFLFPEVPRSIVEGVDRVRRVMSQLKRGVARQDLAASRQLAGEFVNSVSLLHSKALDYEEAIGRLSRDLEDCRQGQVGEYENQVRELEGQVSELERRLNRKRGEKGQLVDRQKGLREELIQLRDELARNYDAKVATCRGIRESFLEEFTVPVSGSLQVVGLPIFMFGFERGGKTTLHPYFPRIVDSSSKRGGGINFKRTRVRNHLRGLLRKLLRDNSQREFTVRQGVLQDLTRLPRFRRRVKEGLGYLFRGNWISSKVLGSVERMLDGELEGLEYKERAGA